jgi:hypothetical protein
VASPLLRRGEALGQFRGSVPEPGSVPGLFRLSLRQPGKPCRPSPAVRLGLMDHDAIEPLPDSDYYETPVGRPDADQ